MKFPHMDLVSIKTTYLQSDSENPSLICATTTTSMHFPNVEGHIWKTKAKPMTSDTSGTTCWTNCKTAIATPQEVSNALRQFWRVGQYKVLELSCRAKLCCDDMKCSAMCSAVQCSFFFLSVRLLQDLFDSNAINNKNTTGTNTKSEISQQKSHITRKGE